MSKVTVDTITSGYNLSKINANFVLLQDELNNNVLYRTNPAGEPNSMSNDVDMNSNNLLNANTIAASSLTIGGKSVVPGDTLTIPSATNVPFTPEGNISAVEVQSAIEELDNEKIALINTPVTNDLVLQAATGALTKAGFALPNVNGNINASDEELNFSVGVTSNIQTQLDSKLSTSSSPFTGEFASSGQTITSAGTLVLPHGLGSIPSLIQLRLKCTTAELGYAIDDEVIVGTLTQAINQGVSLVPDATNLNIRYGSDGNVYSVIRKDTGVVSNITNSSWLLKARAWA